MKRILKRQGRQSCLTFFTLVLVSLLALYGRYRFFDTRFLQDPSKLRVTDYEACTTLTLDRADPLGRRLLEQAICPAYLDFVLSHDVPLALSFPGEFTLPNLRVADKTYMLIENPVLRYE